MKSVEAGKGWIKIKGTTYRIPQPTPTDSQRIADRMRELAIPECTNPLLAVNAIASQLSPAVLQVSLEIAGRAAWGGGIEPTKEAVDRQYGSLAGLRFIFLYLARRDEGQKDLTVETVDELITEPDRYDLIDALGIATGMSGDGKDKDDPKASGTGAS